METKSYAFLVETPSRRLKRSTTLASAAGSLSDVPLRTLQSWVDKKLIIPEVPAEHGTGSKHLFNGINCIEVGIIKALTKERFGLKVIKEAMNYLRHRADIENLHDPDILNLFNYKSNIEALIDKEITFLIIGTTEEELRRLNVVGFDKEDVSNIGKSPVDVWAVWTQVTNPFDLDNVFILNTGRIVERIFKKWIDLFRLAESEYTKLLENRKKISMDHVKIIK